jgi:uncharacterized protein YlxP (DUF503 family)
MLLSRLRSKFNLSAAEVGAQDVITLIDLGVAAIAASAAQADSIAENVTAFIRMNTEAEILSEERALR